MNFFFLTQHYCISVNDGHRVKGENNAFQDGKTFWLSGYVGRNKKRNGPFQTYFYNNTIYVADSILSKIAVDHACKGVLVMNNLFYIVGESKHVLGDQYKPAEEGPAEITDVTFQNNVFLKTSNWPKETMIQPANPLVGDPQFLNPGGFSIVDYIPTNRALIEDQGMPIPFIPKDIIGLTIGLEAIIDILGNPIKGKPDLGAIELN